MKKIIPLLAFIIGLGGCSSFYFNRNPENISENKEFRESLILLQGQGVYRDITGKKLDIPYKDTVFAVPEKVFGKNWEYKTLTEKEVKKVREAEKRDLENYFLNISTK